MNQRLGIVGGISIIGTTGIVEPMSEEAFKASLAPQIDVALAEGHEEVILTPGRIGERNARERGIPEDAIVEMSNFVGFMLKECARKGVDRVLLLGHVGKLAKVAAGVFHTHSKVADARLETIAAHAALMGGGREVVEKILRANTTEEAVALLRERGLEDVFDAIAAKASSRAMEYVGGAMTVGTVLLTMEGEILGRDDNARSSRWARYLL
jgi:cobalt-precorrin-5B (C1)-methyltransferase